MRNVYFTLLLMLCMSVRVKAGDWMKRLPDYLFVSQVSIPGTHDSATGNGFTSVLLAQFSQCQDIDVATQWSIGIRAFDFRPKLKDGYLNINHGIAETKLRFDDALCLLRDSLKEHPTEFAVIHCLYADGYDEEKATYETLLRELLSREDLKDYFVPFRRNLTVGDMRGKILLLSRDKYADKPITGGFFQSWCGSVDWNAQTSCSIIGENGTDAYKTPLYVQDYSNTKDEEGGVETKVNAVTQMLDFSTKHETKDETDVVWVFNFASAYDGKVSTSNGYRENATHTNAAIIEYLQTHEAGPTGVILMDYCVNKSPNETNGKYVTRGRELVDTLISNNFKWLENRKKEAKEKAGASLDAYESVLTHSTANKEAKGAYSEAIEAAKKAVAEAAFEKDVDNAMSALEAARREYVRVATPEEGYPFDMTFLIKNAEGAALGGWTTTNKVDINQGQHWDGTANSTYIEPCDWWATGWDCGISQTITLPDGKYTLTATGRASAYVTLTLTAGEGTTTFPALEDRGGTIATDGTEWESVEVGLAAGKSFANNDLGRGWTIGKVSATVMDGTLAIEVKSKTDRINQWCSISDFKLLKTGKLSDEEELTAAKKYLKDCLAEAEAITDKNVGDGAFQIPTEAYAKLGEAIAAAKAANDSEETDATTLTEAKETLQKAVDEYGTVLNPPAEGKRYNIVLTYGGWDFDNKAVTYIANGRTDAGNYNMQYLKEVDANYAQAFTFTAAAESGNTYYLSQTDEDGNERYVCTGTTYGGNNDQLRTTTNKEEALAVEVRLAADKTGIYNLYNTAAAKYIGSQDAGFFTVDSHNDFKLLEAKEAEVTLTMPDYGWATLILPFDAEIPEGMAVHTWNGTFKEGGTELDLQDERAIKANTPYIVSGSTGKYEFKGYGLACKAEYSNEHMGGFIALKEVTLTDDNKGFNVTDVKVKEGDYVFQKHGDEYGFYKVGETQPKVVAYKAYLKYTAPAGANANLLNLPDTRGADNVDSVLADGAATVDVYSVGGILVRSNVNADEALDGLPKGVYIVGGKKKAVK